MKQVIMAFFWGWATLQVAQLGLQAQSSAEPAQSLTIQNIKHPKKPVQVDYGRKIKVFLKDDRTYKGVLSQAGQDSLWVDSLGFAYRDMEMVRVPGFGSMGAKISGLVVGLIGFAGFAIGLFMILIGIRAQDANPSDGCGQALFLVVMFLLGAAIGLLGSILFFIGLITVIIGAIVGKAFRLDGRWKLGNS